MLFAELCEQIKEFPREFMELTEWFFNGTWECQTVREPNLSSGLLDLHPSGLDGLGVVRRQRGQAFVGGSASEVLGHHV